jgi:hypothetical protein
MPKVTVIYNGKSHELEVDFEDCLEIFKYQVASVTDVDSDKQYYETIDPLENNGALMKYLVKEGAVLKLSDTPVPFERNLGPPGEVMQGPPPSEEQIQEWQFSCSKIFFDTPIEQPSYKAKDKIVCHACATTCQMPGTTMARANRDPFICQCSSIEGHECLFAPRSSSSIERVIEPLRTSMMQAMQTVNNQIIARVQGHMQQQQQTRQMQGKEIQFAGRIEAHIDGVKLYEDPELQKKARALIPVEDLSTAANKAIAERKAARESNTFKDEDSQFRNGTQVDNDFRDEFMIQMLHWFKKDFFEWVNELPCHSCKGKTKPAGRAEPVGEEKGNLAFIVELYQCTFCNAITRFPRYNHPSRLLETRKGRCGEWANCFALMCRAVGYETRSVFDWTDHVWVEIFSENKKRWIHCDSCEAKFDTPLLYEVGWNKKLNYALAFGTHEVVDVTRRYTRDWTGVKQRRTDVSEDWLARNITTVNNNLLMRLTDPAMRTVIVRRRTDEAKELEQFETLSRGSKQEEEEGRISGSTQWKEQRGELGKPKPAAKKPQSSHIPQTKTILLDSSNLDVVFAKIQQFNQELGQNEDTKHVALDANDIAQLKSVVDTLKDSASVNKSINSAALDTIDKTLQNWPINKIFPVLDVTRLMLTNDSGNNQLCQRSPFGGKKNIFEFVLQLQSSLSANQLLMLRFLCNAIGAENSKQALKSYLNEAIDALVVVAKSEQKAIKVNLATCLINFVVAMKDLSSPNSKEEQKLYELCVSLVSKEKEVEVLFRALVSLGTLLTERKNKNKSLFEADKQRVSTLLKDFKEDKNVLESVEEILYLYEV